MNEDIYNKIQKLYINNYEYYDELLRREKKIYNYIWNEIINMYIHKEECELYSCKFYERFSFSSELILLLIMDGFDIKILINNDQRSYELAISKEKINEIMNSDNKTKSLQK